MCAPSSIASSGRTDEECNSPVAKHLLGRFHAMIQERAEWAIQQNGTLIYQGYTKYYIEVVIPGHDKAWAKTKWVQTILEQSGYATIDSVEEFVDIVITKIEEKMREA